MKQYILSFFILFFLSIQLTAQQRLRPEMREKVKTFKVEFFKEELALTSSESRDFFPIYEQYEQRKKAIKKQFRANKNPALIPDSELEEYLIQLLDLEQRELDLKKEFFREVKGVLPLRKVVLIPTTERKFKKKLLEEMRRRRQENGRVRN